MKKKHYTYLVVVLIITLPFWMFLAWCATPKKKLVVAIIDKTVLTPKGQEHISLTWVLDHERFTKNKTKLYKVDYDYFGFFPEQNEKYRIKGLERFSAEQLNQLSVDADMVYITDAYGIYKNEWYKHENGTARSGIIYGGLSTQDLDFLANMKSRHKLILTEFNSIGSPTPADIRDRFEQLFSMHWTGWVGRYFESLDTTVNTELPKWLINDYKRAHNQQWPFRRSGVAFVNDKDDVVVLENGTHITDAIPEIISPAHNDYGLPTTILYPFWFDIITTDTSVNTIVSRFDLHLNEKGRRELADNGIPFSFPAVQMHMGADYKFAYFSADFSDNPIKLASAYFKGVEVFKFLFYNHIDKNDRARFFWLYYRPLITRILHDYYQTRPHHN